MVDDQSFTCEGRGLWDDDHGYPGCPRFQMQMSLATPSSCARALTRSHSLTTRDDDMKRCLLILWLRPTMFGYLGTNAAAAV